MIRSKLLIKVASVLVLLSSAAMAQADSQDLSDKLDRMQRDLNNLQRHVYRGDAAVEGAVSEGGAVAAPAAGSVDSDQLEERLRAINGKIEQLDHRQQKFADDFEKYKSDVELRLKDLESAKMQKSTDAELEQGKPSDEEKPSDKKENKDKSAAATDEESPAPKKKSADHPTFETPQEHYSYAFKQLNAAKFDAAKQSLESFIEEYPNDPLIGNAYYWLGEIYYVKRDYVKSSEAFGKGYESLPNGSKAPDNLYRLGMSLSAQQKTKEACVMFTQAKAKFPKMSDTLKQNIESERKRISCK